MEYKHLKIALKYKYLSQYALNCFLPVDVILPTNKIVHLIV